MKIPVSDPFEQRGEHFREKSYALPIRLAMKVFSAANCPLVFAPEFSDNLSPHESDARHPADLQ